MLNVSNIHIDHKSKFKVPKAGPLSSLNGAKIVKIGLTI